MDTSKSFSCLIWSKRAVFCDFLLQVSNKRSVQLLYHYQSNNCITVSIANANQGAAFSITDTKICVTVVILSTEDNAKLLQQLKLDFKRTTNWNKYQSQVSTERLNQYLHYLIHPSFQGINRLFVLSFEDEDHQTSYRGYFFSTVEK